MSKAPLCAVVLVALVATNLTAQRGGRGGGGGATPVGPPRFTYLGPENGGRIAAVAGVPGDTSTYYFGAATGGIWKTTDGAKTFAPVFDDQPVQSIGALATAPSNPRIVWAGTGEAWAIRDADVMGDGVYKSTDAGATWQNMGLKETGRIGKIVVHPTNPNIVYVCALGRATGPQQERGVFRTTDGGATWTRVLFVDENTGCSGLSIDVSDPKTLFAATWEVVMHTWAMFSGGNGSGVYVSHDSGSTWKHITDPGLPHSPLGKIEVAVAPSNSKRVYALIQTPDQGSLWRSDDGGDKWKVVSWDRSLIGRAGYYIRMEINPQNELEVLIANSIVPPVAQWRRDVCDHRSRLRRLPRHLDRSAQSRALGGDGRRRRRHHARPRPELLAIRAPDRPDVSRRHRRSGALLGLRQSPGRRHHARAERFADSGQQRAVVQRRQSASAVDAAAVEAAGVVVAAAVELNRREIPRLSWLPAVEPWRRPTRAGMRGLRRMRHRSAVAAAGAGAACRGKRISAGANRALRCPTPGNPDIIWASCYGNTVTRFDNKVGLARSVSPWMHTLDMEPNKAKYRCHWTPPLAIDPFDPARCTTAAR